LHYEKQKSTIEKLSHSLDFQKSRRHLKMSKRKKILVLLFVLLLFISGGLFYWRTNSDIRELNRSLPSEIRILKTAGSNYKLVNNIDEYKISLPQEWKGLKEVKYLPPTPNEHFSVSSINLRGNGEKNIGISIDFFKTEEDLPIIDQARRIFNQYGLEGQFNLTDIGNLKIAKTQEYNHLGGEFVYFFKENQGVYALTGKSESSIKELIKNGTW